MQGLLGKFCDVVLEIAILRRLHSHSLLSTESGRACCPKASHHRLVVLCWMSSADNICNARPCADIGSVARTPPAIPEPLHISCPWAWGTFPAFRDRAVVQLQADLLVMASAASVKEEPAFFVVSDIAPFVPHHVAMILSVQKTASERSAKLPHSLAATSGEAVF